MRGQPCFFRVLHTKSQHRVEELDSPALQRGFPSQEGALTPGSGTHGGWVPGARLPTSSWKTIKKKLLLVFDIPVTTLKTQSLSFNPQITSSNIINVKGAWGEFIKQAVSFLGGPSCRYLNCFHGVSFLSISKCVGVCTCPQKSGGNRPMAVRDTRFYDAALVMRY